MKKNKFLALTMLCSVLSGVSANAQEVKNSGSQTTGEVKNSSGNKGTSNSDKNVEKITKKAPNSKKVEDGNSSGSKKSDVKKGDKEVTKDKAKDSGKVGWEDFKKRFGDGISSFVDLVKRHPIWSSIIGISGGITIEEGVRRTCFKQKNNNPHKPEVLPKNDNPHKLEVPPKNENPQPVEIWGVNKFGYKEDEDCIYRNPNGKINVVLIGPKDLREEFINKISSNVKKGKKYKEFINKLKKNNNGAAESVKVGEDRLSFDNWNIIGIDCDYQSKPNENFANDLNLCLKNDVTFAVIIHNQKDSTKSIKKLMNPTVKKIKIGNKEYNGDNVCLGLSFQV